METQEKGVHSSLIQTKAGWNDEHREEITNLDPKKDSEACRKG